MPVDTALMARLRTRATAPRSVLLLLVVVLSGLVAGCGTSSDTTDAGNGDVPVSAGDSTTSGPGNPATRSTFSVEVWADNWMAVYVDGELVGEDSVPITTERSFNAETFTFEATYPFTIAIEAKDFKETDSGIEYIGQPNQQMGDGGLIAQVTDTSTGEVVATTGSGWSVLVVQRAPLNTDCADDPDPDATCEYESTDPPSGWAEAGFDDSRWTAATEWSTQRGEPQGRLRRDPLGRQRPADLGLGPGGRQHRPHALLRRTRSRENDPPLMPVRSSLTGS